MFERFNKVVYSGIVGGLAGAITSGMMLQNNSLHMAVTIGGGAIIGGALGYLNTRSLKP